MLSYLIRRIGQGLLVLIAVIWFTFTLSYLQPEGADAPAYILCGTHQSRACLNDYITQFGLNKPYFERLWSYLVGVFTHFNLGTSFRPTRPVASILAIYIPRTLSLAAIALVLATVIALPVGIYQAWRRNSGLDYAATGTAFVLYSVPAFVFGYLLLDAFSFHTLHLPDSPPLGVDAFAIFSQPSGFILPIVTLTALSVAGLSRFMRSQVLDVLVQDYIRTARAKGIGTAGVLFRHTMRNALGPIVVIIGLSIPALLSGALIVEEVFNYQGLGYETVYAANNLDLYTVLGITVVVTMATVAGNILADIGLVVINPRVRIEGRAQ